MPCCAALCCSPTSLPTWPAWCSLQQCCAALRSSGQAPAAFARCPGAHCMHATCPALPGGSYTTCHAQSIPSMPQGPAPARPWAQQARWGHLLWTAAQLRHNLKRIYRTGDTSRPIARAVVWLQLLCELLVGLFMSDFDAARKGQCRSQRGDSVRCSEHGCLVLASNGGARLEKAMSHSPGDMSRETWLVAGLKLGPGACAACWP